MESNAKSRKKKPIGLAIVGSGRIGRTRALIAQHFPAVEWMGLCDLREGVGLKVQEEVGADYFSTDYRDLLARPEVNAVVIATEENEHVLPTIMAAERGHSLFIEKPLATDPHESEKVLKAVQAAGVDAAVGYTQRFRRRFLLAKEKVRSGGLGEVTSVTVKAFMNRMSAITTVQKAKDTSRLTPMVVSGTHSLDLAMWLLEGKKPVEVYARSVDKALGEKYRTKDATFGIFTFEDGTIWSMCISWALPVPWPGQTYGLDIGIVGTTGVLTIDDTHRDLVLATEEPHLDHRPNDYRKVSFLTSYPPGDMSLGHYRGPIREETNAWLTRVHSGMGTQHATVADAHRNLLLTMAMDKSAATGKPVKLPITPDELR